MKIEENYWLARFRKISQKSESQRLLRLKKHRKRWLDVHLWLGLSLGLLLSIYGITGSILVFNAEIDELLNHQLLTVNPPKDTTSYQPLVAIFDAGKKAIQTSSEATFATYPRNARAAFILNYSMTSQPKNINENWQITVDPYTAQVLGKRLLSRSDSVIPNTLIGFLFSLHYSLFLGENISAIVVGTTATLLIISMLTGLILWWPLTGQWHQALTIKPKSSGVRFNYDLHKTTGFYTVAVMLPVLFSGIYMVLPEQVVPVIELFSPVTYRYWFQSIQGVNQSSIGMNNAIIIATQRYPTGRPNWIYGAPELTNTYTICLDGVDSPGSLLHRRCVVMDRYSGKILDLDDPTIGSAGEVFTQWQWPLHSGQAFGWTGRILVFLSGLACPVLFVTGMIRWLQKRKAAAKKHNTKLKQVPHKGI